MHFCIARNYSRSTRSGNEYVVAPFELSASVDMATGEVRFRPKGDPRWSTYCIARPAEFEGKFPQLKLRPGEGPYEVAAGMAETPRTTTMFAGVAAPSLGDVTGHRENEKRV